MTLTQMEHKILAGGGRKLIACLSKDDEIRDTSTCTIEETNGIWNISAWYTEADSQNQGYGAKILKEALRYCFSLWGPPSEIQYTWNGQNPYVMDWLERNFNAQCNCPLAVQKTQAEDDWDSHIYTLNKEKMAKWAGAEDA